MRVTDRQSLLIFYTKLQCTEQVEFLLNVWTPGWGSSARGPGCCSDERSWPASPIARISTSRKSSSAALCRTQPHTAAILHTLPLSSSPAIAQPCWLQALRPRCYSYAASLPHPNHLSHYAALSRTLPLSSTRCRYLHPPVLPSLAGFKH
jgi:hypothetical protein